MNLREVIRYCPRCGSNHFPEKSSDFFLCAVCDFHFHINCTPAVGGIVLDHTGSLLLIRRGKDPGKGKFSIPGGFVDGDESVEAAMARELREEVSLEMISAEYLCSHPNLYQYRGVTLPVVDLIFVCEVRSLEPLTSSEEVDGFSFVPPDAIDLEEIAFPSIRYALELFRRRRA